jgi:2-polyprenyl-6-hydroxyphenyl methylase/3-demethylubiquinone-9 3-methyltransferase
MNIDQEIGSGRRFEFGANWTRFLTLVDDQRIEAAELSFKEMLGVASLDGQSFLDIGCGSGLSSLVARRLGANVYSFDCDPQSVACTRELKRRYFPGDETWVIREGSVLDRNFIDGLGQFDVVYSWGVLHHTGAMWGAIENALRCVSGGSGKLFVAIYNDQGWKSHGWWLVKWFYNKLPRFLRPPFAFLVMATIRIILVVKYTCRLEPMTSISPLFIRKRDRGMSARYDEVDWIGGFPFEFASFDALSSYFEARGLKLINKKCTTSWGCNELILKRCA